MIAALLIRFKGWIAAAVALIGALLFAWTRGRSGAREDARVRESDDRAQRNAAAAQEIHNATQERANVENEIDGLPAGAARDRLRRDWGKD